MREFLTETNTETQYSLSWWKKRLGRFNASSVGALIGKDPDKWTETARGYIRQVAGERLLLRRCLIDEDLQAYIDAASCGSRATEWGHVHEPDARAAYEIETGRAVSNCGSVQHETLCLSASPDGIMPQLDGLLEIKCPYTLASTIELAVALAEDAGDGQSLKKANATYYWQVVAQMLVTGASWVDFVVFDPRLNLTQIRRIERNEDAAERLAQAVKGADVLADKMIYELS